ncbi:MAG: TonB-dependent receptor [Hyphomicrobiaceae bacterium]
MVSRASLRADGRTHHFARRATAAALALATTLLAGLPARAQTSGVTVLEGVVVTTPDRGASTLEATGSAVTVIGPERIAAAKEGTVADILKGEPGLVVAQSGGIGGVIDVRIRGAETNHTLVMVDGVRVSDPTSTGGEFDFGLFSLANVERIEIVRGPQSGLYGSEAIGGVINIVTKKGEGPPRGFAEVSAGSYRTVTERAGLSGSSGPAAYSVAIANTRTSGFSKLASGTERDGANKQAANARFDYTFSPAFSVTARMGFNRLDAELDTTTRDRAFDYTERTMLNGSLTGNFSLLGGRWKNSVTLYAMSVDRLFYAQNGALNSTSFTTSRFEGNRAGLEWQSDLKVREVDRLTFGAKIEREAAEARDQTNAAPVVNRFDAEQINKAAFALYQFNPVKAFTLTAAGRVDEFGEIGTHATWRLSAAWRIAETGTKLRASYGTGAKAPTFFQRFESSNVGGILVVPNPGLAVETSKGWDAGVDQSLLEGRLTLSATYFDNAIDNLIEFTFLTATSGQYQNLAAAETRGVETEAHFKATDWLTLSGAYTWLEATDAATGLKLRRRPEHTAKGTIAVTPFAGVSLAAHVVYQSEHFNRAGERDPVAGFARLDASGEWKATEAITLFFLAENLTDVTYQEVRTFATPGRSGYAGIRWRF